MRRLLILVLAICTLMVMATGLAAAARPDHAHSDKAPKQSKVQSENGERVAPAPKVDVCHRTGDGEFHLINVSGNALDAHLAHGDALAEPGPVPGLPTFEFDENCVVSSTKVVEGSFSGGGIDIAFTGYVAFDDALSGMGSYAYSVNGRTMEVEVVDICLDEIALTATVWGSGDPSWQDDDGFMVLTLVDTGGGSMATRALYFDNEAAAEAAFATQCLNATTGASGGTGFLTFL